jgi:hypothetical protein
VIEEAIVNESETLNDITETDILEQNICLEKSTEAVTVTPEDDDDDAVLEEVLSKSNEETREEQHEISEDLVEEAVEEEITGICCLSYYKSLIFDLFVLLF